jgi:hypothetical protein
MWKPYNTPKHHKNDSNPLAKLTLARTACGVLSGSESRKWVYVETE